MSDKNREIVEKVNSSFAEGNTEGFLSFCSDDLDWTMVGEKRVRGKDAVREWMSSMEGMEPPAFTVNHMIADGDLVACSGDMTMKGEDGKEGNYGFCDIYRFGDGEIKELTSYVVKVKPEGESQSSAGAA